MTRQVKAHAAVLLANIFFAISYIAIKYVVPGKLPAPALNLIRVVGSVILFWLLFLLKPSRAGIERKDIPSFFICALTGVTLNQILFVKGLSLTSAIHASLLALVTPILIIFFAAWFLKERLTWIKIAGIAMGISGAVILILMKDVSHTATNIVLGDVLVILNAVSYAFYFVFVKPLMRKYSAIHIIRWVFTIGLLFMLPYGWTSLGTTNWETFQFMHWLTVAFIIICATFLAYLCNIFGVSAIGASATGSYIYTQPVFTAILAIIFTGETLDWLKLLAAVLIFCGVYLANFKVKVS